MSGSHRAALKQDFYAVREVLRTGWNPVGVDGLPDDEYDPYVWPIVRLLKEGADETALAEHLHEVELFYFGRETAVARLLPAARALIALGIEAENRS
jgi:hypothetical protein